MCGTDARSGQGDHFDKLHRYRSPNFPEVLAHHGPTWRTPLAKLHKGAGPRCRTPSCAAEGRVGSSRRGRRCRPAAEQGAPDCHRRFAPPSPLHRRAVLSSTAHASARSQPLLIRTDQQLTVWDSALDSEIGYLEPLILGPVLTETQVPAGARGWLSGGGRLLAVPLRGGENMERTWLTSANEAFDALPRPSGRQRGVYLGQVLARSLRGHLAVVPSGESLRGEPI